MNITTAASALLGTVMAVTGAASSSTAVSATPVQGQCVVPSHNLMIGSRDSASTDVTVLQQFLQTQGYLKANATGYFGALTLKAVEQFQSANGITPTGYVGALTRARIATQCGTSTTSTSTVKILSINPTSGPVGTTVSITGTGFTADNIVHFGGGAIGNVAVSSSTVAPCPSAINCNANATETLTITIPSSIGPYCAPGTACPMYEMLVTPNTYMISVQNENGTSNAVSFTVTGGNPLPTPTPPSANSSVSITGIDAPTTLALGSIGVWTVHATEANFSGNLSYNVSWGDQEAAPMIAAQSAIQTQSSATFTHVYNQAGTYQPTFTVSDSNGNSATASASVVVTPLY